MNYLKKKLKPLTLNLTHSTTNSTARRGDKEGDRDLEDDLYDEYIIEAPPHPSELLSLGVDPSEIDVNDPEKLKELYRKAKEEGKDKKTNSVLLARQRQKEEIEEKKKTREEWKFFESITSRVEQAVKESQKSLEHLKESSAINKITEPEFELRLSADQVFKSSSSVKQENSAEKWVKFSEEEKEDQEPSNEETTNQAVDELDEFGCPRKRDSRGEPSSIAQQYIVEELLEDLGIDLRTEEQKRAANLAKPTTELKEPDLPKETQPEKLDIDLKIAARPRPKPNSTKVDQESTEPDTFEPAANPFDTSFITESIDRVSLATEPTNTTTKDPDPRPEIVDPFDTSYVNF